MAKRVSIGEPAPEIELPDLSGRPFRLSALRREKAVVLVFNRGFS